MKFEQKCSFQKIGSVKYGHLQKIITSVVIYFEIYYTGSFSKYSCKILGLLFIYFFHYNSSNLKKMSNFI